MSCAEIFGRRRVCRVRVQVSERRDPGQRGGAREGDEGEENEKLRKVGEHLDYIIKGMRRGPARGKLINERKGGCVGSTDDEEAEKVEKGNRVNGDQGCQVVQVAYLY